MPHVIVKLYPGRSEEQKKHLADAIVNSVVSIAKCDQKSVSVAFEEIEESDWPEKVYKPDILDKNDSLIIKPGYNPFESLSGNCRAVILSVSQIFNRFYGESKLTLMLLSIILPDSTQYLLVLGRFKLTPGCRAHSGKVFAVGL